MILKTLEVLKRELNTIHSETAIIEDISKADTDGLSLSGKIVITLLNVVEEPAMKNASRLVPQKRQPLERYKMENPATYLNLYVMITANKPDSYEGSLLTLASVIEHFQAKNILVSPAAAEIPGTPPTPAVPEFEFTIHLNSLPFEQLSYAWGLLGGKIIPSVLYKLSIIKIQKFEEPVDIGYIADVDIYSHANLDHENWPEVNQ